MAEKRIYSTSTPIWLYDFEDSNKGIINLIVGMFKKQNKCNELRLTDQRILYASDAYDRSIQEQELIFLSPNINLIRTSKYQTIDWLLERVGKQPLMLGDLEIYYKNQKGLWLKVEMVSNAHIFKESFRQAVLAIKEAKKVGYIE